MILNKQPISEVRFVGSVREFLRRQPRVSMTASVNLPRRGTMQVENEISSASTSRCMVINLVRSTTMEGHWVEATERLSTLSVSCVIVYVLLASRGYRKAKNLTLLNHTSPCKMADLKSNGITSRFQLQCNELLTNIADVLKISS